MEGRPIGGPEGAGKPPPQAPQGGIESRFKEATQPLVADGGLAAPVGDGQVTQPKLPTSILMKRNPKSLERKESLRRMEAKVKELQSVSSGKMKKIAFATIIAVGVIILLAACPALIAPLLAKGGIMISGHALTMGLALAVPMIYWGFTLVNTARRGKVGDVMQQKLRQYEVMQHEFTRSAAQFKDLSTMQEAKGVLEERTEMHNRLVDARTDLENSIESEAFNRMPQDFQTRAKAAHENISALIGEGAQLISEETGLSVPELDHVLDVEKASETLEGNLEKLQRMELSFSKIFSLKFYGENPVAGAIMLIGIAISLTCIPMAVMLLHGGALALPVIGSISLSSILTFLAYGLCIAYIGYDWAAVSFLKKKQGELETLEQGKVKAGEVWESEKAQFEEALVAKEQKFEGSLLHSSKDEIDTILKEVKGLRETELAALRKQLALAEPAQV